MNQAWFNWRDGSFGFVLFGWWLHVKAPWNKEVYLAEPKRGPSGWLWQFRKLKGSAQ